MKKSAPPRRPAPKTRMGMNKRHEKMESKDYEDMEEMEMDDMPMKKNGKSMKMC